jgi:hypothetical protein
VTRAAWQQIVDRVESACEAAGLDLVYPFNLAACDFQGLCRKLPLQAQSPLRHQALGILVGNTRRLWPRFVAACQADPSLTAAAHPLDRYVVEQLSSIGLGLTPAARVIFAHVTEPAAFPIQRLAEQIGFATLSPSQLAIHPEHGPWFALRAVMLIDVEGPPLRPRAAPSPCSGCSAPCLPALEHAVAVSGSPLDAAAIARQAPAWIAVRDACPIGRGSRYGKAQLAYHYAPAAAKLVQES